MSTKYKNSKDIPTEVLCKRLEALSDAVTKGHAGLGRVKELEMSNVSEMPKPKHGDQKNWRIEQEDISKSVFKNAAGNEFKMVTHSSEQSVSERFCTSCDKWVTAKGIFGGIWCPNCNTAW